MPVRSYSQLSTLMNCEYKFHLRYIERLEAVRKSRPPTLGSAIHLAIATTIADGDVMDVMANWAETERKAVEPWAAEIPGIVDETENLLMDVLGLTMQILPRWEEWVKLDEWETVYFEGAPLIEHSLMVDYAENEQFIYIPDWVATYKPTGEVWVIDWKSREQRQPIETEQFNMQKAIYCYLLRELGIPVAGSRICQIYPGVPVKPQLLKDGKRLSKAQIRTDWPTYLEAIHDHGFEEVDYTDMQDKIEKWDSWWFEWLYIHRGDNENAEAFNNFIELTVRAQLLENKTLTPVRAMNGSFGGPCGFCEYQALCLARMNVGVFSDDYIHMGYKKRDRK